MKEKILALSVIAIVCFCRTAAQDREKGMSSLRLGIKAVAGRPVVTDRTFSSIPYHGISGGVAGVITYNRKKALHEAELFFSTGRLRTEDYVNSKLRQIYATVDYTNLYQVGKRNSSFSWRAGGGLNFIYARRKYDDFINRDVSYEFVASLAGALEGAWSFKKKLSGWSLSNRVVVPFVSSVIQPAYGYEGTEYDRNIRVLALPGFLRIKNRIRLEKNIAPRQRIAIDYTWDYYQFREPERIKQVNHLLGFAYNLTM